MNIDIRFFLLLVLIPITLSGCGEENKPHSKLKSKLNQFIAISNAEIANIAHRGGSGTFPESTILAFEHATSVGVDFLEMDVRLTSDNYLVVHHDRMIDRTSDGLGLVTDYTLAELKQFNFAHYYSNQDGVFPYRKPSRHQSIVTLEEVFKRFPDFPMIIEIKDSDERGKIAADILLSLIVDFKKKEHVIVASFHQSIIDYLQESTIVDTFVVASQREAIWFFLSYIFGMDFLYTPQSDVIAIPTSFLGIDLTKKSLIETAHRRRLAVHYWTINDKETIRFLIQQGADGIMSDYPELVEEILTNSTNL